ncbi:DotU family type IV/VI secretion system protein [uncultured Succinivibrio sp.]|uniref:DotU family type IV/VI secretion system protein n=1 Tax=uncultured Succinivibrio sp. TaxID=540749 RepID=UPI0025EAA2D7|nr:DotU family type IV/VI secretion system protein [uncultured Succinivibrio sp.]
MDQKIEYILNPIFKKICEYYSFKKSGYEVPKEFILSELKNELTNISHKCASYPILQQQYSQIEKPLIFFIDYSIKEGGFSYSDNYQEIARTFNEFSGDEKFFDLLSDCLRRSDDEAVAKLFYIMMGLGFDGSYKRNRADVLDIMKKCAEQVNLGPDFHKEKISPDIIIEEDFEAVNPDKKDLFRQSKFWILLFGGLAFLSFVINWISFASSISSYVDAVDRTTSAAMSKSSIKNTGLYEELNDSNSHEDGQDGQ